MAHKIHLMQTLQGTPACAATGFNAKTGKTIMNSRTTYRYMSATVVPPEDFRAAAPEDRCAHCCARFTPMMNARRKAAGVRLYKDAMTKTLA